MNTRKMIAAAFITALLSSSAVYAVDGELVSQQVPMISGGVGDAGLDDITVAQQHYNLKLIFAENDGAYLADVSVLVRDRKGNTLIDADSDGPIFLTKLEPGTYSVTSSIDGHTKTQKVTVNGKNLKTYYVHLNPAES